jgi:1,4-dihydroxy-2-naphthoate octaprenyltransferase
MTTSRLQCWLDASRPKTLWAAVAPVIIGTAMAASDGSFHFLSAGAALFAAVMIQIGTNLANDYFDFKKGADTPDRVGPTRVTQAGLISPRAVKRATTLVFSLAVLAGIYLVWRGGWPIVIIGTLSILFGILYTAGPLALGYIGLGDLFVFVFFGPVAVAGTFYVQALTVTNEVIIAGIAPGLLSVAILTVNNLRDIDQDATTGKKTLAARFGRRFARTEYLLCVSLACIVPILIAFVANDHAVTAIAALIIVPVIPTIRSVYTKTDGPSLNTVLASTGRLLLLYSLLFSIGYLL